MKHPTEASIIKKYSYMDIPPFENDKGWNTLLANLFEEISLSDKKKTVRVLQVKEKFGSLRCYVQGYNKKVLKLIVKYENISAKTCEICGEEGHCRVKGDYGWYKTLCDKHATKLGYVDVPKKECN